jgi:hypothetical protein
MLVAMLFAMFTPLFMLANEVSVAPKQQQIEISKFPSLSAQHEVLGWLEWLTEDELEEEFDEDDLEDQDSEYYITENAFIGIGRYDVFSTTVQLPLDKSVFEITESIYLKFRNLRI